jgi:hypothetical protein
MIVGIGLSGFAMAYGFAGQAYVTIQYNIVTLTI